MKKLVLKISSIEEMQQLAYDITSFAQPSTIIALNGDLGAGKTTFTKGIGKALDVEKVINSPTFTIMKIYDARKKVNGIDKLYHLDVYRLNNSSNDFELEEYFYQKGLTIIEWASIINDLLPDDNLFMRLVEEAKANPDTKVFIGDLITIDENNNITGKLEVLKYAKDKKMLPTLMLWLGRNLYVDVIFAKKETFIKEIYNSYLIWNMPFWANLSEKADMLDVKNVDFPMLKYRLHSGNYINNEIGKLNVINGELRTVTRLMEFYNIPMYKTQFYIYRIFNKLKLASNFSPLYFNREEKNKGSIVEFVIQKRFGNEYDKNIFLKGLVEFYKSDISRKIYIKDIDENEFIYKGKDMRLFNNRLLNNELSELYLYIINEMKIGFNEIVVSNEEDIDKAIDITKFLCLYPYVKVSLKNNI